jgi:hypothetical protein
MASATASLNGKPQRKQLSDQIDRLDGIIDCLAEALPAAVGDATREGTRQAVREAITAVLTDPEVQSLLKAALAPSIAPAAEPNASVPVVSPTSNPGLLVRLKAAVGRVLSGAASFVRSVGNTVVRPLRDTATAVRAKFDAARRRFREVACVIDVGMKFRQTLLVAAGFGLAVAAASQLSHAAASVLAGVGATVGAVAVQLGLQVRRFFGGSGTA